jgi:TonB family protein
MTRHRALLTLMLAAAVATAAEDEAAIRAHMADIETRLACGATSTDTIYVYRDGPPKTESMSLAPWILQSDSGLRLVATPHHPLARGVDSVYVLSSSGEATITRKAGTGADDFVADSAFRSVILNARKDAEVHVRLCGTNTFAEFSMSDRERQTWREMTYYFGNFGHRTHALPDIEGLAPPRGSGFEVYEVWSWAPRPRLLHQPPAYYPDQMKKEGVEGRVVVDALMDTTGAVRTALVYGTSGYRLLDLAAVRAALSAAFVPPGQRDWPVRPATLSYPFRLR